MGVGLRWSHILLLSGVLVVGATAGSSALGEPDWNDDSPTVEHTSQAGRALADIRPVPECMEIDTSGRYRLADDVVAEGEVACVRVTADDVTLDGGGRTVDGGGSAAYAVRVRNATNVTVRDVRVTGATTGISFWNATGGTVEDVVAVENFRYGVRLWRANETALSGVDASRNLFAGVRFDKTQGARVDDSIARQNGAGVSVGASRGSTIEGTTVEGNTLGVELAGATNTSLVGNAAEANDIGVIVAVSWSTSIEDNTVRGNTDGIRLVDASDTLVRGNRLSDNDFGLFVEDSSGTTIQGNTIDAGSVGVQLTLSADDNRVVGNVIRSADAGIRLTSSSGNVVTDNDVRAVQPIVTVLGTDNTVDGNTLETVDPAGATTDRGPGTPDGTIVERTAEETSTATSPGFGVTVAVVALLSVMVLLIRHV